jgi:hypothetical protein
VVADDHGHEHQKQEGRDHKRRRERSDRADRETKEQTRAARCQSRLALESDGEVFAIPA